MRFHLPHRQLIFSSTVLKIACLLLVIWNAIDVARVHFAYVRQTRLRLDPPALEERVFVASIFYNNEAVLRNDWIPAVLDLAKHLGPDNVFISVQESGSRDDSKGALRLLNDLLQDAGIRRRIVLDDTTHKDELDKSPGPTGWVHSPQGRLELRRIPYLSRLRNFVLEPLHELVKEGEHFDKVLFINDVVFTVSALQGKSQVHAAHSYSGR